MPNNRFITVRRIVNTLIVLKHCIPYAFLLSNLIKTVLFFRRAPFPGGYEISALQLLSAKSTHRSIQNQINLVA